MASKQQIIEAANDSARQLGYEKLKDLQLEVVIGIVSGQDVISILPTGYGKSLCYGCYPGVFNILDCPALPSIVCVVTPLTYNRGSSAFCHCHQCKVGSMILYRLCPKIQWYNGSLAKARPHNVLHSSSIHLTLCLQPAWSRLN